ncbi:hypothetical protein A1Q1_03081 [Trichosporon asahii var. asahii CBS 2479]|uniref:Uncharacterized protein n=1 Tax=Trichosporon asahii var. asahii (strain ATCC 90039 / CBS 2479 / JCM 2466 / KCTC 7840 / NBRC 103889/ NCYC 2677 / UAMH 7654) TaxID=1186058 RepID=J6FBY8_TRIAS|nr:hypothetical protein A1Q1_03081 [Trichosporon asahii var. asahii CBS 2479]EJT52627.1 hypothetical protein A1Q1_03081 [Trichosporon asahii var. asahii CBS 2479]
MDWVLKRLDEFITMTFRDYAYFRTADVKSSQVHGIRRVITLAGEPGPFPHRLSYRRPFRLKLIDCQPPTAVLSSESFKWLQYLYQGKIPAEWHSQFPPMSCSVKTLINDPRWSCCEARALFVNFHQCDVEVHAWSWEAGANDCLSLKGINGLTVLFLTVSAFSSASSDHFKYRMLACLSCGSIIIEDLAQHRVRLHHLALMMIGICKELEASVVNWDNHSFEILCRHLVAFQRLGAGPFAGLGSRIGRVLFKKDRVASQGMLREPTTDEDFRKLRLYAMLEGCEAAFSVIAFIDKVDQRISPTPRSNQPAPTDFDVVASLTKSITEVLLAGFKNATAKTLRQAVKQRFQQRLSRFSYCDAISIEQDLNNMKRLHMRELASYDGVVDSEVFFRYFAQAAIITFSAAEMNSHFRAVLDWFGELDVEAMKQSSAFGYSVWVPGLADAFSVLGVLSLPYLASLPTRLLKFPLTDEERDLMKQHELYLRVAAAIAARQRPWYASVVHHALDYRSPRLLAISDANPLNLKNARFPSVQLSATTRIIHQVPQFPKAATLALVTIPLLALGLWSFYPSGAASSAA